MLLALGDNHILRTQHTFLLWLSGIGNLLHFPFLIFLFIFMVRDLKAYIALFSAMLNGSCLHSLWISPHIERNKISRWLSVGRDKMA
jgi:hypothetical protein